MRPETNHQLRIMQENLVIVESPAKAKTIEKFLGKDFKVMSSYGHIRDLKKKEIAAYSKYITKPEDVDNLTQQDLNMITMKKMGF